VFAAHQDTSGRVELVRGAVASPAPSCFNSAAATVHPVSAANMTPAIKSQIEKARRAALASAKR
jgi:hypothetical protein